MCSSTLHSHAKFSMNCDGSSTASTRRRGCGDTEVVDPRQHVVQAVAELVEERDDVVVVRSAGLRRPAKGNCTRGRRRAAAVRRTGRAATGPRPSRRRRAFRLACIWVEIEPTHRLGVRADDAEKAHARIPGFRGIALDFHAVDRLDDAEHAFEHFRLGKVLLHFLARERIAFRAELLRGVGHVPRLQPGKAEFLDGEIGELGVVALREGSDFSARSFRNASTCSGLSASSARAKPRRGSHSRAGAPPRDGA